MTSGFECAYCGERMIEPYISCCGEVHFIPREVCPECESDAIYNANGLAAGGIETNYQSCEECGHQWGHQ